MKNEKLVKSLRSDLRSEERDADPPQLKRAAAFARPGGPTDGASECASRQKKRRARAKVA
jgi:hypothetical protein